ncbi:proline--tRNA ligase [Salimicrobium jeotgali]|uniref:Proline--tRNA ligase n=1 Tax=Salimicrobium jeotgali TaxID=1230341 RepID=K2FPG4_9BACI|nr:proline--tRNA ligase [Salimicrobium jeotgali]AKG04547.1 proline--tRNA ligase [Salimicrobium jeotgali]EKE32761.1 prolyl-tRNA ligase [Salimicrobium jeotgali]MBM7695251.1 prolyl-tRNA synthetase [Salimicrobium jeotgali]
MRQSKMLVPTLKENPAEADIASHQLLVRAGYIRQLASGIYTLLPLGKRVLTKIETVIRQEMDRAGAQEMLLSALQPAELWQESGRWYTYGSELMRMKDRHDREFALGATHEEAMTSILRNEVGTYKKLPMTLYQIQNKFRDEKRPRFGLLRGREFLMKDAYSFNESFESLDQSYQNMYDAYCRIFERLGLNYRAVIADSGAMGGKETHEFMVLSEVGEDVIAYSDTSKYAANVEMAPVTNEYEKSAETTGEMEKVSTPDRKTMQEVADYLGHELERGLKSIMFKVDDEYVLVVTRGDHEVNDVKVKNFMDAKVVDLATEEDTVRLMGTGFGSLGPVGAPKEVKVVADYAVEPLVNVSCGANEEGYHYKNVTPGKDFVPDEYADMRFVEEGDPSPDGEGVIKFARGIEVGHVFKLGSFYAENMGATFLDNSGKSRTMVMGSYGIGVSRTLAAMVEQFHDDKGIVWPKQAAPYLVHILSLNPKKEEQRVLADNIYADLLDEGIEVLYDDRPERAGVKFADSDLIGIPLRIIVGKRAGEEIVEVKMRNEESKTEIARSSLMDEIKNLLA